MWYLLLCFSIFVVGAIFGAKVLSAEKEYKWIGKFQFAAVIILVLSISIRIGADERVIQSLGDIGLSSFVITVFVMGGSILSVHLMRKWMGLDKKGRARND